LQSEPLDCSQEEYKSEVVFLYNNYFKKNPPTEIINLYTEAHTHMLQNNDFNKKINVKKIITLNLDIEAIEYALRLFKGDNSLSSKHKILSYLMEVRSENYDLFHHSKSSSLIQFFFEFIFHGMRSVWKLFFGIILCMRYKWFLIL